VKKGELAPLADAYFDQVIKHPKLLENYPELKDVKIRFDKEMEPGKGNFDSSTNSITVSKKSSPSEMMDTISH